MSVLKLLKNRPRSRAYTKQLIPSSVQKEIFRSAQWAPSSHNYQPWHYTVIADSFRQKLNKALPEANLWARHAPLVVAVWGRVQDDDTLSGKEYYLYDIGASVMALVLSAQEHGVITNQLAGFHEAELVELLQLPKGARIIVLLALGYPKKVPPKPATRKPLESFVHLNSATKPYRFTTYPAMRHLSAGGVVVVDHNKVALVRNKESQAITLPKGHLEKGETKLEAARREVEEETGLTNINSGPYLGSEQFSFLEDGRFHIKTVHYYLFTASLTNARTPDHNEPVEPLFMPFEEAVEKVTFPNTRRILKRVMAKHMPARS